MPDELVPIIPATADPIPAFTGQVPGDLRQAIGRAVDAWLLRTPSPHTRRAYRLDLDQFLAASGIPPDALEHLAAIRPEHVSQWRERLAADKQANSTIRRKLTALRSLFSYLQTYGYSGANPAHGKFVKAPAVSRDGKTVGLSPHDCRRLLNAPEEKPETANAGRLPRPGPARRAGLFGLPRRRAGAAVRPRLQAKRRAPHPQRHRQGRQGTHHAPAPGSRRAAGRLASRARHQGESGPAAVSRRPLSREAWAATASATSR